MRISAESADGGKTWRVEAKPDFLWLPAIIGDKLFWLCREPLTNELLDAIKHATVIARRMGCQEETSDQ